MGATGFKLEIDKSGLEKVTPAVRKRLGRVVREALAGITGHARESMSEPKTGQIYERGEHEVSFTTGAGTAVSFTANRGKKARQHQASAPGEAPARDEGHLDASMGWRMTSETSGEFTVGAEYAAALEFGTDDGHLAARPFVGPAVAHVEDEFRAECARAVQGGAAEGNVS